MSTGVTSRVLSLTAAVLVAASLATSAGAGDRFTVSVAGGGVLVAGKWSSTASWPAWAETAQLGSQHETASGSVLGGAVGYRASRHLGVVLAVARSTRDAKAALDATIPHPLVLDRPRTVTSELSGLSYRELATHLDLEWRTLAGPFELALFAGPTMAKVETDAVEMMRVNEAYPYDAPTFQSADTTRVTSDSAFGWNAGGSAAWLPASYFDLGVEARYSRASVELKPAQGDKFTLESGGLQLTVRLGVRF